MERQQVEEPARGEGLELRLAEDCDGWQRYDAVPRDGPAVFVVEADSWDNGEIDGVWVNASVSPEEVAERFSQVTSRPVDFDQLVVVDQVGLGPQMVDEDWFRIEAAT